MILWFIVGSNRKSYGYHQDRCRKDRRAFTRRAHRLRKRICSPEQLSSILAHVEKLNELDTEDTPPMSHCAPGGGDVEYTKRDDEVRPSLGQELAVENAPDTEAGYFKVPRVIGGEQ